MKKKERNETANHFGSKSLIQKENKIITETDLDFRMKYLWPEYGQKWTVHLVIPSKTIFFRRFIDYAECSKSDERDDHFFWEMNIFTEC